MADQAFVTLATNDSYCLGALVVAASLRKVKTTKQVVCMITPSVSSQLRNALAHFFDQICLVNVFDSRDSHNLTLLDRPDLGVTFTKLHCWRLVQYSKCVFLDADTLVLHNVDELFSNYSEFSAAPDPGWPDCFNSGVFVYSPSEETYDKLLKFAAKQRSFDGADQGLLNQYFSDWSTADIKKHLPFLYNVVSQAFYSYLPAFKHFGAKTKICHFIGAVKPWHHRYDERKGAPELDVSTGFNADFLNTWWQIFRESVIPVLSTQAMEDLMPQLSGLSVSSYSGGADGGTDSERRERWEKGAVDYTGKDSFSYIQRHLDAKLSADSTAKQTFPDVRPKVPSQSASTPPAPSGAKPKKSALKKPKD